MRPLLALLVLLSSDIAAAQTDGRTAFLTRQLSSAKDARARAQAALMLGAAHDASSAPNLCAALKDESALVRLSVVRSLGMVNGSVAKTCLVQHGNDSDDVVQAERTKVLAVLAPSAQAPASLYIALTTTSELGGGDAERTVEVTQTELQEKLKSIGGVMAPAHEDKAHASAMLRSQGLRGIALRARLSSSSPGGLTLNLMCFTYPSQALLGEVSVTASGAGPVDLVKAIIPKVLEEASETCNWSH